MSFLAGCGSDNGAGAISAPQPENSTPTLNSYDLELTNVDDEAYVYINGDLAYSRRGDSSNVSARMSIDRFLTPSVPNEVEVILGNGGCFASSLTLNLYENGVKAVPERNFQLNVSHCGFQLRWRYVIGSEGGVTRVE
jgi:hypothetical protein